MKYVPTNLTLPEFFKYILKNCKTVDEKAALIKQHNRKDLHWLVDFMYNGKEVQESVKLPDFIVSTKPVGNNYLTIGNALPKINAAITHRANKAVFDRNMRMVLESVSADESKLLVDVFAGRKIEGISKAVFERSLPMYFRTVES